jgi:hypothetical protein
MGKRQAGQRLQEGRRQNCPESHSGLPELQGAGAAGGCRGLATPGLGLYTGRLLASALSSELPSKSSSVALSCRAGWPLPRAGWCWVQEAHCQPPEGSRGPLLSSPKHRKPRRAGLMEQTPQTGPLLWREGRFKLGAPMGLAASIGSICHFQRVLTGALGHETSLGC